jgi:hypothetical protein
MGIAKREAVCLPSTAGAREPMVFIFFWHNTSLSAS